MVNFELRRLFIFAYKELTWQSTEPGLGVMLTSLCSALTVPRTKLFFPFVTDNLIRDFL